MFDCYDTFNTKVCPYELIFVGFNDQPILSDYYNFLNDDYGDGSNIPGTPVNNALPYKKGVEYVVVPNNEDINDEIIIDDDEILNSAIDPLQNESKEIEGVGNENEGRYIEVVDVENEVVDS